MHTKASIIMKILTIVTPRLANHLNEGSIGDVAPRLELHRIPESQEKLLGSLHHRQVLSRSVWAPLIVIRGWRRPRLL